MEAKDTVMSSQVSFKTRESMLERQAEISFKAGKEEGLRWIEEAKEISFVSGKSWGIWEGRKAGIKEVAEWVKNYEHIRENLTWVTIPHYDWQAQLEKWGVLAP